MTINRRESVQRYVRDSGNIESFLLVSAKTSGSADLTVTMVEMQRGGNQMVHSHAPEQMYHIMAGRGIMHVDGEEREVKTGDSISFGPHAKHGLRNTGDTVLKYMSAASPSFSVQECDQYWPLPPADADE